MKKILFCVILVLEDDIDGLLRFFLNLKVESYIG